MACNFSADIQTNFPNASRDALAHLAAQLDAACDAAHQIGEAARGPRIGAALAWALTQPELVPASARLGSPAHYTRHLLYADPLGRYTVASLVWWPQQHSPVHAHHTWCGYSVLNGKLTEMQYLWDACKCRAVAVDSVPRPAGGAPSYVEAGLNGIHRLGNGINGANGMLLSSKGAHPMAPPAVSLHVYGVAAKQMATHVNHLLPTG